MKTQGKNPPRNVAVAAPLPNSNPIERRPITIERDSTISLRAGEPGGAEVIRVSDALLQYAIRRIEHPSRDREEDIHAVRTAIKRVRAILRLIRPAIGDTAFRQENRRLQKTARLLGSMRDAAIGLQTLRGLAMTAGQGKNRIDVCIVHDLFAKHAAMPQMVVEAKTLRATLQALQAHRRRLRKLRIVAVDWEAIEKGIGKVCRACRRRMKRAQAGGDDDSFHRWRIRLKNLYYELQFLMPLLRKRMRSQVARLRKVQELIGDDHDIAVLKAVLQSTPERFGGGPAVKRVVRRLEERSRRLRRASQPLAKKILKEQPRRFLREIEPFPPCLDPKAGVSARGRR